MATVVPSNTAIQILFATKNYKRLLELEADQLRRDEENRRTVNTDRGPVRD